MSIILAPGLVLGTEGGEGLVGWRRREQSYCVIEAERKREREAWEGDGKGGRVREGGMEGGEGERGREREGRRKGRQMLVL